MVVGLILACPAKKTSEKEKVSHLKFSAKKFPPKFLSRKILFAYLLSYGGHIAYRAKPYRLIAGTPLVNTEATTFTKRAGILAGRAKSTSAEIILNPFQPISKLK